MSSSRIHHIRSLRDCLSVSDLRELAMRRLPRAVFDFYDGGAEDETTLAANRASFGAYVFSPHVLCDVSQVSTTTELVGARAAWPAAIAPTGACGFGHRGADIALALAAAHHQIPYTLSSSATTSIETIANKAPGRHWFQVYVLSNRDFFWKLIDRAYAADYEALVITVDLPVGGKRERDNANHFSVPFRFTTRNVLDFASRPRWAWGMLRHGMPVMENLRGLDRGSTDARGIASSVGKSYDASFDWDRLAEVRERWTRRLIVKGVCRGDDALRLANLGVDAVVVSNHGGRQLDGAVASFAALPEVVQSVGHRIPVLMDGGVRRGADIAKALALGAQGVLLGRATLFGAVAAGAPGAMLALDILHDELVRCMRLCGATNTGDLSSDLLRAVVDAPRHVSVPRSLVGMRAA